MSGQTGTIERPGYHRPVDVMLDVGNQARARGTKCIKYIGPTKVGGNKSIKGQA
jgi:hypothetical protein